MQVTYGTGGSAVRRIQHSLPCYNYILCGRIKGTASAVFVIQHRKAVPLFLAIPFMHLYTHTISFLWHGRECCTQNIALGTGSREQYSTRLCLVLYCYLDPAPHATFCIQHSLPCYNYYIMFISFPDTSKLFIQGVYFSTLPECMQHAPGTRFIRVVSSA